MLKFKNLAFALYLASTAPSAIAAEATNETNAMGQSGYKVQVIFTAAGCARVAEVCNNWVVSTICKMEKIAPGEKSKYNFKGSQSNRQMKFCTNDGNRITKRSGKLHICQSSSTGKMYISDHKCPTS